MVVPIRLANRTCAGVFTRGAAVALTRYVIPPGPSPRFVAGLIGLYGRADKSDMSDSLAPAALAVSTDRFADLPPALVPTVDLIKAMLAQGKGISDLAFSPGRAPQVEKHGELVATVIPEMPVLRAEDTAPIALDLIGSLT